jgi:hypothetical protein
MSYLLDTVSENNQAKVDSIFGGIWKGYDEQKRNFFRNEQSCWYKWCALHYAVYNNNQSILESLLQHQFIARLDDKMKYPLEYAVENLKWTLVKIFSQFNHEGNVEQFKHVIPSIIKNRQYAIALSLLEKMPAADVDINIIIDILLSENKALIDALLVDKTIASQVKTFEAQLYRYVSTPIRKVVQYFRERNELERMGQLLQIGAAVSKELIIKDATDGHWQWVRLYLDNFILEHPDLPTRAAEYRDCFANILAIAIQQNNLEMVEYLLQKMLHWVIKLMILKLLYMRHIRVGGR